MSEPANVWTIERPVSASRTRFEELRVNPEGWPENRGPTPAQIPATARPAALTRPLPTD